jgi:hypothetical protein
MPLKITELLLSPRTYAAVALVAPLPLLAGLISGDSLTLTIFSSHTLATIAVLSCACIILATALRIAVPRHLLARGSSEFLIPTIFGIVGSAVGSSLGGPGLAWASVLLAYLGIIALLSGGRFAAYLTPGVALLAALPFVASLAASTGYAVTLSPLGASGVFMLVSMRSRSVPQDACEYCASYAEKEVTFCDYCGRRLPGHFKLHAPGKRFVGVLAAGLVLVALALGSSLDISHLLGSVLNGLSARIFQAGAQGVASSTGGLAGPVSGSEYAVLVSAVLAVGTVASLVKKADMTNVRRFDNSLGLDEQEFAIFASLANEGRGTGAELLNSTNFSGGWAALDPLLEKLARLGLMKRVVVFRRGTETMLWKSNVSL